MPDTVKPRAPDPGSSRRFTPAERSWIAYDWANSVYATIIMAAVFPIYFAETAKAAGTSGDVKWGFATSLATLVVALLAPILGSIADFRGYKKRLFSAFLIIGLVFTLVMGIADRWQMMLVGYMISYVGFAGSLLFYDSFLTDVSTPGRMDKVSAWGYAMGYLGGSTIPFLISIALILFGKTVGIDGGMAVRISVFLCVAWWAAFSLPILRNVRQVYDIGVPEGRMIRVAFKNVWRTALSIVKTKPLLVFLVAYFFYIDGVNTVIHMATVYGSTLGLGTTGMILALLLTQIVAVPFSIGFSRLAARVGSIRMIRVAILIYLVVCIIGFWMGHSIEPHQGTYLSRVDGHVAVAGFDALTPADREKLKPVLDEVLRAAQTEPAHGGTGWTDRISSVQSDRLPELALGDPEKVSAAFGALRDALTREAAPYRSALSRASILFWLMAVLVGTSQGGIQALSRSYFGKLIPPQRSNEYFGFFDIFGKFAAVLGPSLYAATASLTGRSSLGILSLMVLFICGFLILFAGRRHLS